MPSVIPTVCPAFLSPAVKPTQHDPALYRQIPQHFLVRADSPPALSQSSRYFRFPKLDSAPKANSFAVTAPARLPKHHIRFSRAIFGLVFDVTGDINASAFFASIARSVAENGHRHRPCRNIWAGWSPRITGLNRRIRASLLVCVFNSLGSSHLAVITCR